MKSLYVLLLLCFVINGCKKDNNTCQDAEVVHFDLMCSPWGIQVGNNAYVADGLPAEYEQDGLKVCVKYRLYNDLKMCPCCGGTRAQIFSIERR